MTTAQNQHTQADQQARLQQNFRDAFRDHPAGVSVLTATVDGEPVGLTVSSLASLTMDPLAVSFSLMKTTGSAGKLLKADSFLIHFLTSSQADVAASFAQSGADKFLVEQGWQTADTGEPILPSARVVLRARIHDTVRVGEATLVAAEITEIPYPPTAATAPGTGETIDNKKPMDPLVYKSHRFYSLGDTPPLA